MGFPVTERAMRPARPNDRRCFYCNEPVGGEHGAECELVRRERLYEVRDARTGLPLADWFCDDPAFWAVENARFHKNESTWCADNALDGQGEWGSGEDEVRALVESQDVLCACGVLEFIPLGVNGPVFCDEG